VEVHENNRRSAPLWQKYVPNTSFKFVINGYNHTVPKRRQRDVVVYIVLLRVYCTASLMAQESFSYMAFEGKIDLQNPEIILGCFEECGIN
jgi:tRNA (guanine10-N2)-methyltransferase